MRKFYTFDRILNTSLDKEYNIEEAFILTNCYLSTIVLSNNKNSKVSFSDSRSKIQNIFFGHTYFQTVEHKDEIFFISYAWFFAWSQMLHISYAWFRTSGLVIQDGQIFDCNQYYMKLYSVHYSCQWKKKIFCINFYIDFDQLFLVLPVEVLYNNRDSKTIS